MRPYSHTAYSYGKAGSGRSVMCSFASNTSRQLPSRFWKGLLLKSFSAAAISVFRLWIEVYSLLCRRAMMAVAIFLTVPSTNAFCFGFLSATSAKLTPRAAALFHTAATDLVEICREATIAHCDIFACRSSRMSFTSILSAIFMTSFVYI